MKQRGLRRARGRRRARVPARDEHLVALGDRDGRGPRAIPSASSACTSSTRSRCCRSSRSSARPATDDVTLATAWDVTRRLGKRGVLVDDAPAFVVNRMLTRQSTVLMQALESGNTFEETDEAALRLGIPMPPSALLAMVGPRVANHVLADAPRRVPRPLPALADARRRSRTARCPRSSRATTARRVDEIHERILEALADEARHILDEGVVATAAEIDACLILGAGYPVLPRRDHEAPRPDRRLASASSAGSARPDVPNAACTSGAAIRGTLRGAATPARLDRPASCLPRTGGSTEQRARAARLEAAAHMQEPTTISQSSSEPAPELGARRAARRALVRRAVPPPRRGRGRRARARHRAPPGARRRDRGDRRPDARAVLRLEGPLRPDARPRARARAPSRPRPPPGTEPAPPPDRRARRDADRADRGDPAQRRRERQRQRLERERRRARRRAGATRRTTIVELVDEEPDETAFAGEDPGASRRYRFRHPTASGKTIAAAGFVESARELGVLILTHRRLLVDQFRRDLTTEGYGDRLTDAIEAGQGAAPRRPDHDPDVRLVRPPRRRALARRRTSS